MRTVTKISLMRTPFGMGAFVPLPAGTELKEDVEYSVEITTPSKKKKRSLDANAYCWVLCQKIAERLSKGGAYVSKEDVYRNCIKDCGTYYVIPVKTELVSEWQRIWEAKGIGWVTEVLGKCQNIKGYSNVLSYYGSSEYNTEQMARLIDALVDEAQQLGVETMRQEEINSLLDEWRNNETQSKQMA